MNWRLKITIHIFFLKNTTSGAEIQETTSHPKIWPSTNISLWHKLPERFYSVFFFLFFSHTYKEYTYLQIFQAIKSCWKVMNVKEWWEKYFKVVVGPVRDPKRHWNPLVCPPAEDFKMNCTQNVTVKKRKSKQEIQLPTQWQTKEKKPTCIEVFLHDLAQQLCIKSLFCLSWQKLLSYLLVSDITRLRGDVKGTCTSKVVVFQFGDDMKEENSPSTSQNHSSRIQTDRSESKAITINTSQANQHFSDTCF